ncbi:MAG: hypothetical protein LBN10_00605 [Propionibacteriaceae bacterium]|nr:hypothetical protein [Propionibacteriaceae bacterium]
MIDIGQRELTGKRLGSGWQGGGGDAKRFGSLRCDSDGATVLLAPLAGQRTRK